MYLHVMRVNQAALQRAVAIHPVIQELTQTTMDPGYSMAFLNNKLVLKRSTKHHVKIEYPNHHVGR